MVDQKLAEIPRKGLNSQQSRLLQLQYQYLRESGKVEAYNKLVARSRFLLNDEFEEQNSGAAEEAYARDLQSLLPIELCRRLNLIVLEWANGELSVGCSQPLSQAQRSYVMRACVLPTRSIKVSPASRHEVLQRIAEFEQTGSAPVLISELKSQGLDAGRLRRLVYALLREALDLRASDIHFARKDDPDAWVVFRVDSVLRPIYLLPASLMQPLVARIKIESGMDASNNRSAQDGRMGLNYKGRNVDCRVSTQPLVDGESLVMRILDSSRIPGLHSLFPWQSEMLRHIRGLIDYRGKSGGLVLVTGATGSGKSTTQYTLACGFDRGAVNVITVEDPVEYSLPFAKQIQLQSLLAQKAIELERSILRQDPDILVFGEIRDADSARAALAFSESGHMVFSTLHANSVLQVPERFLSIVDSSHREDARFLLANYLRMVIHQKLVGRLCSCSVLMDSEEKQKCQEEAELHFPGVDFSGELRKAVGCSACQGRGYRGRVVAHETMVVPPEGPRRLAFSRAFLSNSLETDEDLTADKGIEYISRWSVLIHLVKHGVIDWDTLKRRLNLAEKE